MYFRRLLGVFCVVEALFCLWNEEITKPATIAIFTGLTATFVNLYRQGITETSTASVHLLTSSWFAGSSHFISYCSACLGSAQLDHNEVL